MPNMRNERIRRTVYAAMFLAIGMLLPLLTGQLKEIGDSLLPMHLAVMLCGLFCGKWYGLAVGVILPFLRSVIFGMPPFYPNAVWMALELATYGFTLPFMYRKQFYGKIPSWLYASLITSMLAGRAVWGIAKAILLGVGDKGFTIAAFFTGGFIDAIPGIILQLILIPLILTASEKIKSKWVL